jgi:hypothetical protein
MEYTYIDEHGIAHKVHIHNFDGKGNVRVIGGINLNPVDKNYPDKKWVKVDELLVPAKFTEHFIKKNMFN